MPETTFHQSQELGLQQRLSPQMRQSLEILQATALELRQLLRVELETNPVLEDDTESLSLDEREDEAAREDDERESLGEDDDAWRDDLITSGHSPGRNRDREERLAHLYDSITPPVTLASHVEDQTRGAGHPPEVLAALPILLGSLDDRGFLTTEPDDLALTFGLPLDTLESARRVLLSLDPPGLGSRTLSECLALQLEQRGRRNTPAWHIARDHLEALARNKRPEIARALGIAVEDVNKAAAEIATLDPYPARNFSEDENRIVNPDLRITPDGRGGWTVELNNDDLPRLRINSHYKEMLGDPATSSEARNFIRDRMRGGRFLIQCIEQRQETLRRIAGVICEEQDAFLRRGADHLRPLTMQQVATRIGVHETTVSRAIAGKFVETPQGVLDLRRFFTAGFQTASGSGIANTSVKERIARLVESEDPGDPLSDDAIVITLQKEGLEIARRTVAKYRNALGIPASHLRRRHG